LLSDKYKLESLQGDGSRTRQEIPQKPAAKLEPVIVAFDKERRIPAAGAFH